MTHVIAGRYELVEPLGRNGTGPVWRARDLVPDREIAVQEVSLPDHLGGDATGRAHARIVREARAATRLDHPGIVTVHDVVEEGGRPWVDVSEALQNAARSFADDPEHYPGYAEERFTELRYLGDDAAELQFRFDAADLETRMRMRLFRFDGALYSAILTAQLDRWEESVPHYEMFLRTLRRS
ncbi:hypothetical protein GCM10010182_36390 [Actinomadura cremea]|nr:hypothetical protein GCM10010182_36390 [Actinomadura cremea]